MKVPTREQTESIHRQKCQEDFRYFYRNLWIDGPPDENGDHQRFREIIQPFQERAFDDLGPSLQALREKRMPLIRRFWIERTKGASKDSDLAVVVLWLMAFPLREGIEVQVVAANGEQASIIIDRATRLLELNPWLTKLVDIVERRIRNVKRRRTVCTRIESSGRLGAKQGKAPDLLILNELVHVDKGGWDAIKSHRSNATKTARGILICSTNAGYRNTPAWEWRKQALMDARSEKKPAGRWAVHIWSKLAPWIDQADVEEDKRSDPIGIHSARLWEGRWVDATGSIIGESKLRQVFCLEGVDWQLRPGWTYFGGLDMGINHDHAGLVILGTCRERQKIRVCWYRDFAPDLPTPHGLEVDSDAVERECLRAYQQFSVVWFGYDPAAGGSVIAQRLRRLGVPMREWKFNPANLTAMARSYVSAVKNGVLESYDDADGTLLRDFGKFEIESRGMGDYRLVAVSDEHGHADVGTAVVVALPKALESLGMIAGRWTDAGDEKLEEPWEESEAEDMPEFLRDIYEQGGESPKELVLQYR